MYNTEFQVKHFTCDTVLQMKQIILKHFKWL